MDRFVPREKMSKKARWDLDRRRRVFWPISPVTRVRESGKRRDRLRAARPCDANEAD